MGYLLVFASGFTFRIDLLLFIAIIRLSDG